MKNDIRLRIGITLFLMLLFSYFYFMHNPWSANSRTRMALALSLIEDGSVIINKYHQITIDKSIYYGSYYADKAPGYTFTALPAVWAGYVTFKAVCGGGDAERGGALVQRACSGGKLVAKGEPNARDNTATYIPTYAFDILQLIGTWFASGLVSALTALVLYFFAIRIGAGTGGAVFAALTYGLATPAWAWSTAFQGHVLAGSCLFLAFASLYYLDKMRKSRPGDETALAFIAGALLSWAVVVEYTAAATAVIIAVYGLSKIGAWEKDKTARALKAAFAASLIFILPLLIYNYAAFDSPFTTGYLYTPEVGIFTGMQEGFHGITYPRPERFYGILFGGLRGLFWLSPLLLLAPLAIYRYWRTPGSKKEAAAVTSVAAYYILWNSSYFYWHGGVSTGPRFIVPMLPFICLPFALLWTGAGAWFKRTLVFLFIISFCISLISASVLTPALRKGQNVLLEALIPGFIEGDVLQVNILRIFIDTADRGGAEMLLTLIPLFLVLITGGLYIWKLLRQEEALAP